MLKRILDKDDQLSPEDKEQLEMMIAQRNELEHEITARWQADAKSTWLASNVRPRSSDGSADGLEPKPRMRVRILMPAKVPTGDALPSNLRQQ